MRINNRKRKELILDDKKVNKNNVNYIDYETPEDIYITKEEHERVKEIIKNNCNEYEEEIFNMYFKEGKTIDEIAKNIKYPSFFIEGNINIILKKVKFILLSEKKYGKNDYLNNLDYETFKILQSYYISEFGIVGTALFLQLNPDYVSDIVYNANKNIDINLFKKCFEEKESEKTFIKR